ncbi:hypothetical protein [Nakamurella deserti]|uniref:hypothetical protein n=1 Tax=Nakamurella deserti TaxID=2164074 RepID=UPI001300BB3C|nr:hypothetical protein [Nakamurella deserti]
MHDACDPTGRATALRDLRAADAARVLGLLDPATLPERARHWTGQGLVTPAALALAGGTGGTDRFPVLLATVAAEHGVSVADVPTARAVHAEAVLGMTGAAFGPAVFELANTVTDGLTSRVRRWWRSRSAG